MNGFRYVLRAIVVRSLDFLTISLRRGTARNNGVGWWRGTCLVVGGCSRLTRSCEAPGQLAKKREV